MRMSKVEIRINNLYVCNNLSDCVNFLRQLGIHETLKFVMSLDLVILARICSKGFETTIS